nr:AfsR/SARP family transcriptional regulator [Nocardioides thalensis]
MGAPKQRALLASLVLARGRPVSVDGIIDHLWGDDAPPGVTGTLQAYVSQLRRVVEPDRAPRTPATILVTAAPGYALKVPDDQVDAHRFEQAVSRAHKALQALPVWGPHELPRDEIDRQRATIDAALESWRGTPYADLGDVDAAANERTRLEGLRLVAFEDRAAAGLALGDHATVAADLEALTSAHPLRERLWALRAVALARAGRQADALDVLGQVRRVLDEELGIDPSAELRDLQAAVLRQDERLVWAAPASGPVRTAPPAPVAEPASSEPPRPRRPDAEAPVAPWPMIGRDAELAALTGALDDVADGRTSFAALTGEPGIGKSRLAAELLVQARRRGFRVLVGRCSQDEGAPSLWPWKAVLDALGTDLMTLVDAAGGPGGPGGSGGADEDGRFRLWEAVTSVVRDAARQGPTVLLLEDLHWADHASLRVLRLLVEAAHEPVLVAGTWRLHPPPTGTLADVAEALARRHAVRVDLHGLPERDVRTVFAAVSGREPEGDTRALVARTDGNPFFVVELARLSAERGGGVDLAHGVLPAAVGDVLDRRIGRLPDDTIAALRTAAVIGRRFDLATLARAARLDEDDALDVVDPAVAAGLVREDGVDHYLFTHALVRDRLRAAVGASRVARVHARVADALTAVGRETEAAHHWLEAGPAHAALAWRAARDAAGVAARLYDHGQAADLLSGALASMDHDPEATLEDRYAVLMELAEADKWAVRIQHLVSVVEEAIRIGKELRDPERVARAALAPSTGVLWRTAPAFEENGLVIAAMRGSLERLPPGDGELRCRTLLGLALELSGDGEIPDPDASPATDLARSDDAVALAEEGRAMALRLGDPALVITANQLSFISMWSPTSAPDRLSWSSYALELAEATGDQRSAVVSGVLRAMVLGDLGRVEEMTAQVARTRVLVERLRIAYGDLMLTGLEAVWAAAAGRFDDLDRALERIADLGVRMDHESTDEAFAATQLVSSYWRDRPAEALPVIDQLLKHDWPFQTSDAVYRWRSGDQDGARRVLDDLGWPPEEENQLSLLAWSHAAEAALYLGDTALAARAEGYLAGFAGRPCTVGGAIVMAPVDAYLALAARAQERADDAAAHADAAAAQADAWGLGAVSSWLAGMRTAYDF